MKTISIQDFNQDTFQRWFFSNKDGDIVTIRYTDDRKRGRTIQGFITRNTQTGRKELHFIGVRFKYQFSWLDVFKKMYCEGRNPIQFTENK